MSETGGRLRFGICGLGFMGRTYFAHLCEHRSVCVVAVCDRDADRRTGKWDDRVGNLQAAGDGCVDLGGVGTFENLEEMLAADGPCPGESIPQSAGAGGPDHAGAEGEPGPSNSPSPRPLPQSERENIDVVAITLPTALHAELTIKALEAGKHVLCEKPMALSLANCDRMLSAARASGRTLMIGQCIRFWPQYELIKKHVDDGALGDVRFVSLKRLAGPPAYSQQNWLMDCKLSGGALFDLHVHDVDFARHLLGVPQTVSAIGSRGPSGGIDHVQATWRYADGRYALIEGGWVFHSPWTFEMAITVHCERGTLHWSMAGGDDVLLYRGGVDIERLSPEPGTAWGRELDYFIDCVRSGNPPERCPPGESRNAIALVLAEAESIDSGGSVKIDY